MDNSFSQEELSKLVKQLLENQELLQSELKYLRKKVDRLEDKGAGTAGPVTSDPEPLPHAASPAVPLPTPAPEVIEPTPEPIAPVWEEKSEPQPVTAQEARPKPTSAPAETSKTPPSTAEKSTIESLIGGNLINKVGIVVLLIGLAYLMKYSYDKGLLSPLGRIVSGYLGAAVLVGLSFYLSRRYKHFAAVLGSGGIAVAYFATYFGWSFYDLYSSVVAFAVMIALTGGLIGLARYFKLQVVGVLGAVGAYVIPILLDTGSGRVDLMFSYMLVINLGILLLSYRFGWAWLRRIALSISWLFCLVWYAGEYSEEKSWIVLTFFNLFFIEFMGLILIHGLRRKKIFDIEDIALLLFNSLIFFILSLLVLLDTTGDWYPGAYAIAFALVHVLVFAYLHFSKSADRSLYHLMGGLSIAFFTVAIPVELDGSWVTVLWAVEAAALFYVRARSKQRFYEMLGIVLLVLLLISLAHDWYSFWDSSKDGWRPFINVNFLGGVMVCAALYYCLHLYQRQVAEGYKKMADMLHLFAILTTGVIYWTIGQELFVHFDGAWVPALFGFTTLNPLLGFVIVGYTTSYLTILAVLNGIRYRSEGLKWAVTLLLTGMVFVNVIQISFIWGDYVALTEGSPAFWMFMVKFAVWALLFSLAGILYWQEKRSQDPSGIYIAIVSVISSILFVLFGSVELNYLYQALGYGARSTAYLSTLSIFWAVYGLALVIMGIWKRKSLLRVQGIVLLGITLCKLFLYDLSGMSVPGRIVVLIVLGILLLLVSFLYQKFRHVLENTED